MKRMYKKLCAVLVLTALTCALVVPALAVEGGFADLYYRMNDHAGVLTEEENNELENALEELANRQSFDLAIVTIDNLDEGETMEQLADDLYEECQYGYGADNDGALLLVNVGGRQWQISTCGYGITAFTDAGIEYIGKQIKSDLSDGNYAAAFDTYANLCDEFITQARSGSPFDKGNLPRAPLSMIWIPISIVIGVVLALIIVGSMKGKLKTVRQQAAANSYLKKDSLTITESSDLFLYHNVTRTEKPKENSSSGSSTHTSSSGTTHGGRSGKF